ncbi:glycoside hydrolase family protein [Rhizobium sp. ZW T2_16]|uniref:glycoside hydrolase family protein n=1 Tax=Rhizobium sp. ZW T2_16 TaxID=3378083 RepID=UPI003851D063
MFLNEDLKLVPTASTRALAFIKKANSEELTAYYCPAGVPTIGFRNTETVTKVDGQRKQTITKAEAERLLRDDLAGFGRDVATLVKVPLTDD